MSLNGLRLRLITIQKRCMTKSRRRLQGDLWGYLSYDWYEDYLMDVRDEIDADQRETCVKLIRYLLENQVDGCIDWGHIDFQ